MVRSFFAKEDGQGLVEYALILVLIAIVVIGILTLLGGKVSQVFSSINSRLQSFISSTEANAPASLARRGICVDASGAVAYTCRLCVVSRTDRMKGSPCDNATSSHCLERVSS